jgi:hypothetical protein
MRAGTFRCWLFGHNFMASTVANDPGGRLGHDLIKTWNSVDWCVRCGITKKDLRDEDARKMKLKGK